MFSVTQRIKQIKQPYGGYLNPNDFEKEELFVDEILKKENIHSSLVGLAVDYLTRIMLGTSTREAFKISLRGAKIINEESKALDLLQEIKGLDDNSIYKACKLVGYDVCYRSGPIGYRNVEEIEADADTVHNIKIMVRRSLIFYKKYGPVIKDGFTFEGAYTRFICSGEGDFLTRDTLWDFKTSVSDPSTENTLQLLVYYIMGLHSDQKEFIDIRSIGIFNPRKNCIYLKKISDIPREVIAEVSSDVIGYEDEVDTPNKIAREPEADELLSMAETMKMLSCTRYMVMKYYSEKNLPLLKIKNRYFIKKSDLLAWIEEEKRRQKLFALITAIFLIVGFIVIVLLVLALV